MEDKFFLSPLNFTFVELRMPTADDLCREALAGDEVMVQGIVYTSVSPWACNPTGLRLVSVVYISILM